MANKKTAPQKDKLTCLKCHETKVCNSNNFYMSNNPLFVEERFPICKKCIVDYIGEKGSSGYVDRVMIILRTLNKPFLKHVWDSRGEDWNLYIAPVSSLKKDLGFNDSVFTNDTGVRDKQFTVENDRKIEIIEEQMDENKSYNSKWMGMYTQTDISYLETYYTGLCADFKVITTNHKDYARKITKASLHMDKCFQEMLAGVAGADKRYKDAKDVFDTLSQSAQFSEKTRGQNDVGLGGFGVTFDQVEQGEWIPKHHVLEEDQYDKLLKEFATIKESV